MSFDRCTGDLFNYLELGQPPYDGTNFLWTFYGAEFSPDGSKLYVSKFYQNGGSFSTLTQYSITNDNPTSVKITDSLAGQYFAQLQLAPDDKIYITRPHTVGFCDSCSQYLAVIENPNDSGLACNLNLFAFYLNGRFSSLGLPNMPNYNLSALDGSACDTLALAIQNENLKTKNVVSISPNPTTTSITIESTSSITEAEVSDIAGRVLLRQKENNVSGFTLSLAPLQPGIYLLRLKTENGFVVRKVVKE